MTERDDGKLRDSEVALLDAIRTILEIVIAKGILSPQPRGSERATLRQVIDEMLARQSQSYPPEMPGAVFVMDLIRAFVMDPMRAELREQIRRIQQEPPAGWA